MMSRKSISVLFGFLIYPLLIRLSHGVPLNGKDVRIAHKNEFSFVVSLVLKGPNNQRSHFCTGSFVSRKSVLTAAHCLTKKTTSHFEVIGIIDNRFERFVPESWISYEQWKTKHVPGTYSRHDIAMITIKGVVVNPRIIPPVMLLSEPHNFYHRHVRIVTSSRSDNPRMPLTVKTAIMTTITNEHCIEEGRKISGNKNFGIPADYFCTDADPNAVTDCGDSGAPILDHQYHVLGIHTGVCPSLQGYPQELRVQNQFKVHLRLYHYEAFLKQNLR